MTEIIQARHLSPFVYVPRGGRTARWAWVDTVTPVAVVRVDPDEVSSLGTAHHSAAWNAPGPELFAHGDRTWMLAGSADRLLDDLQSQRPETDRVGHRLRMTPWRPMLATGEPIAGDPEGLARRVVWDGRERASREAARFTARDVLFAGKQAFVRVRGLSIPFILPAQDTLGTARSVCRGRNARPAATLDSRGSVLENVRRT